MVHACPTPRVLCMVRARALGLLFPSEEASSDGESFCLIVHNPAHNPVHNIHHFHGPDFLGKGPRLGIIPPEKERINFTAYIY